MEKQRDTGLKMTHNCPARDVNLGFILLQIFVMKVVQYGRHEHAGVGLAEDVNLACGKVRKDNEEVLDECVQISARFDFARRLRPAVREARTPRMLHVQHRRRPRPRVFVDLEIRIGLETAEARRFQGLGDGRVLHHYAAVERGTAGT